MASIFGRNYKFVETKATSTQDKEYLVTSTAQADDEGKIVATSGYVSTIKPKEMYCPDCGCPLVVQNGELVYSEDEDEISLQTCVEYEEVEEDLLSLPTYYNICYGIPADFSLGSETARRLDDYYHFTKKLWSDYHFAHCGEAVWMGNLFILLTSEKKYAKITMENLISCIKDMAQCCINEEVEYLGMPLIGCGKGGLDWEEVREMIIDTFTETIDEAIENGTLSGNYKLHITFCFQSAVTNLTE